MNEMTIRLDKNGAAAVPGGQLLLGYAATGATTASMRISRAWMKEPRNRHAG